MCVAPGCDRPRERHAAKGMCGKHYDRMKTHGSFDLPVRTWQMRFWEKVDQSGDCWLWTGATNGAGYGQFHLAGSDGKRQRYAHRIAYEEAVGPIPEGLTLDHLCQNPRCVRPDHLEPVPMGVNIRRGNGLSARRARQTRCLRGHAFTSTYTDRNGHLHRRCDECMRARNAARYAA